MDIKELDILSQMSNEWEDAAKFCLSNFREIQYKLSIEELSPYEKRMLWINRRYLTGHSRWMVQIVKATNLSNQSDVAELECLMNRKRINNCWNTKCTRFCSEIIGITDILDLIYYNNNFDTVSKFIINCLENIKTDVLINYLPFLIYNLKGNDFLLDIFLEKGISDFKFMSNMYWCIKVYCSNNHDRQKSYIIKTLMTIRDKCTQDFRHKFKSMIEMENLDVDKDLDSLNKKCLTLPICSNNTYIGIDIKNVKIMTSSSRPIIIPFIDENEKKKLIMFKNDDIRKDHIVLNIINIIHEILRKEENFDIETIMYEVMPTNKNTGYIEIVENASTIFNIIENSGVTIQNYILNQNKDITIGKFRERFIKSTALYCVVSYLLGIGDRHLDNIMISKDGLLFHIDFGFILGQDPKYTNNKYIRVTPEIVNVIGGYGTEDYAYFKKICVQIYNRLRLHVNLFSNLLSIIPSIDNSINIERIKKELTERFEIGENYLEAATHMDSKVDSKHNFEYMLIDFLHKSRQHKIIKGISCVKDSLVNMFTKN